MNHRLYPWFLPHVTATKNAGLRAISNAQFNLDSLSISARRANNSTIHIRYLGLLVSQFALRLPLRGWFWFTGYRHAPLHFTHHRLPALLF